MMMMMIDDDDDGDEDDDDGKTFLLWRMLGKVCYKPKW